MTEGDMAAELKWDIRKMASGGIRITVTTISKPPNQILKDMRAYYDKYRRQLDAAGEYSEIRIHVNSSGGIVNSALGMLEALDAVIRRNPKMPVSTLIEGNCSSAATLFLAVKGKTWITLGSQVMIHRSRVEKHQKKNGVWTRCRNAFGKGWADNILASTYRIAIRSNGRKASRKRIREWMESGKRFTAAEAVETGLCTGIATRTEFDRMEAE